MEPRRRICEQTETTTRVLLAVASLLVLLADNHFAQLLLLFLLDRLLALLDHVHLLAVLHHFGQVVLGTEIGNAVGFEQFPPLHCAFHGRLIATMRWEVSPPTTPILALYRLVHL